MKPSAGVALILASTIFLFFSAAAVDPFVLPNSLSVRWIGLGLCLFCLTLRGTLHRLPERRIVPLTAVALCFLGLLSIGWSINSEESIAIALAFSAMITLTIILRWQRFGSEGLLRTMRILAAVVAIGGLLALTLGIRTESGRYAGIFANPNYLGAASALLFPPALALAIRRKGRVALLYGAVSGVLVLETFLAGSRAGIFAMVVAYLYLVRESFSRHNLRGMLRLLVPVVVALLVSAVTVNEHRFSRDDSRSELWRRFPSVYSEAPFLGHGFGTTSAVLQKYFPDRQGVEFHNSYLNLLSDLGALGALLFLVLLWGALRRKRSSNDALAAVLWAGLVAATFESWMFSPGSGLSIVYWLCLTEVAVGSVPVRTNMAIPKLRSPSRLEPTLSQPSL